MPVTPLGQSLSDVSDNMSNFWKNASGNTFRDSQERLKARILANQLQEGMNPIQQRMAELGLLNEESASPANVLGNKIKTALLSNDYDNGLDGLKANRALQQKLAGLTDESAINNIEATKDILPNLKRQQAANELATTNAIGADAGETARLTQEAAAKKAQMESQRYDSIVKSLKEGGGGATEVPDGKGGILGHTFYMPETGQTHFIAAPQVRPMSDFQANNLLSKAASFGLKPDDFGGDMAELSKAVGEKMTSLDPKKINIAVGLLGKFNNEPVVKETKTLESQVAKAEASLEEAKISGNHGPSDQAIQDIFTSTVTHRAPTIGQYAKIKEYQPIFNRLQGFFQKFANGGGAGLTDADRDAIVSQSKALADAIKPEYTKVLNAYKTRFHSINMPDTMLTGEDPSFDPTNPTGAPAEAAPAPAAGIPATPSAPKGGTQQIGRFKVTVH